jgi:hypothetical protein
VLLVGFPRDQASEVRSIVVHALTQAGLPPLAIDKTMYGDRPDMMELRAEILAADKCVRPVLDRIEHKLDAAVPGCDSAGG